MPSVQLLPAYVCRPRRPQANCTFLPLLLLHLLPLHAFYAATPAARALQTIVDAQVNRRNRGRDVRPLRCINTEWMGGVDWACIEALATGQPLPAGDSLQCCV